MSEHSTTTYDNHVGSAPSIIQHILVPDGTRKLLANLHFEYNSTIDFYAEVHLRTSLHSIIRVPLYYHVHTDVVKFTPVDFGLVPLQFDILKVPLYARSKLAEQVRVEEVMLPMSDDRLDF
jgi:hypothetical protein